jgi:hypothetical protein
MAMTSTAASAIDVLRIHPTLRSGPRHADTLCQRHRRTHVSRYVGPLTGTVAAERIRAPLAGTSLSALAELLGPLMAGSLLPFVLVLYLALKGGGYDEVVYGEVGIAAWWIVLLGSLVGVLPVARVDRRGWVALSLLAALAAWTAIGIGWSESAERSVAEAGRLATYLGVFALALLVQGKNGLRRTLNAMAAAISVIAILAVLSRLHPGWFPTNDAAAFFPTTGTRLNYPLNYWNGLAALLAIGLPLVIFAALRSRTLVAKALAAAAIPVIALGVFFTLSRGGAVEIAVGLMVLVALYPRRFELLPIFVTGGLGSALLIVGADQRDPLVDGLSTNAAAAQGNEMTAMVLVVCAGVALLQIAVGLCSRYQIGPRPWIAPRTAGATLAFAAAAAIVVAVAAGAPGTLSDRWQEFKDPLGPNSHTGAGRFDSSSGSGRYQYWESALNANATDPLKGIGPGTYEYWWAEDGTIPGFIRDAHSLYLETLAELGIVGFILIVGLIATVLVAGIGGAIRAGPEAGAQLAAASASCAAFVVAAGIDWVWELAVIPIVFLLLAAAILGHRVHWPDRPAGPGNSVMRLAAVPVALAALAVILIPVTKTTTLRDSQAQVRSSSLVSALDDARSAAKIEPYAAGPNLQQALILELRGDLGPAAAAARTATQAEPTNWRNWIVLSRIEAKRARAQEAVAAYKKARALNPRSPLFAQ